MPHTHTQKTTRKVADRLLVVSRRDDSGGGGGVGDGAESIYIYDNVRTVDMNSDVIKN